MRSVRATIIAHPQQCEMMVMKRRAARGCSQRSDPGICSNSGHNECLLLGVMRLNSSDMRGSDDRHGDVRDQIAQDDKLAENISSPSPPDNR